MKLRNSGVSNSAIMKETERPRGEDIPSRGLACSLFVGGGYFNCSFTLLHRVSLFLTVPVTLGFVGSFFLPGLWWNHALPHSLVGSAVSSLETSMFSSNPNWNPSFFQENPILLQPRFNIFLFSPPSTFSVLLNWSPCPLYTSYMYIFCCLYWVEVSRGHE